jgi:hypothetical protein
LLAQATQDSCLLLLLDRNRCCCWLLLLLYTTAKQPAAYSNWSGVHGLLMAVPALGGEMPMTDSIGNAVGLEVCTAAQITITCIILVMQVRCHKGQATLF